MEIDPRLPSPPQSLFPFITESPSHLGYWSYEWSVGGKSGAEIWFGRLCVREATGFDLSVRRVFGSCDR
ncbi:hypothetical protein LC613_35645 [Nostoc sphaeroides CHAB 2801]|uniref:hypothetical protein n=1 Tax=Nostoc sphaeroides TaxID=446679 RepID=UPI001E2A82DB|nr:hypothetical protein [Nostoc sphaeroides]MCC5632879.1 hypothetical protein [Nostoc sphaeroides CHAB 2801]